MNKLKKIGRGLDLNIVLVVLAFLLYLAVFFSSIAYTTLDSKNYIDGGWKYALSTFRHHHVQSFGNNVFFTYGALSTKLITTVNNLDTGRDFLISVLLALMLFSFCAFSVIYSIYKYEPQKKLLSLGILAAAALCLLNISGIDVLFFVTLIVIYPRIVSEISFKERLILLLGPSLLATYKNSFLICLMPILIIAAIQIKHKKLTQRLLRSALIIFLPIIILWLEGVSFLNLPKYLWYAVRNSLAYGEFMNLADNRGLCLLFFFSFLAYALIKLFLAIYQSNFKANKPWMPIIILGGELWIIFIALKEAITRSDAHLIVFLPFIFYIIYGLLILVGGLLRTKRQYYYLAALAIVIIFGIKPLAATNKNLVFGYTRHQYFLTAKDQLDFKNPVKYFDYSYFNKEKNLSRKNFELISGQTEVLRKNLAEFAAMKEINLNSQSVVGYGNSVFFLPTLAPMDYAYSPFIQNYPAQPPQLFDPLYLDYLKEHPKQLVLWDKIAPNIDSKIPGQDLPDTTYYLQTNYYPVAQDSDHGLFILAKKPEPIKNPQCTGTHLSTSLNSLVNINSNSTKIQVGISTPLLNKLTDTVYKKPIYWMYLYGKTGNPRLFRIVPATMSDDFYVHPWLPFVTDNRSGDSTNLKAIKIFSSDNHKSKLSVTEISCTP